MNIRPPTQSAYLLSFGDSLTEGAYQVHSIFRHVINFVNHQHYIVSISDLPEQTAPATLILQGCELHRIQQLQITDQTAQVGQHIFHLDPRYKYHSVLHVEAVEPALLDENFALLEHLLTEQAHPKSLACLLDHRREVHFSTTFERCLLQHIKVGADFLLHGDLLTGVKLLKGTGWGLTPGGDDLIAGILSGLSFYEQLFHYDYNVLKRHIFHAATSRNLLVNHFLRMAQEGKYMQAMKRLLHSLCAPDAAQLEQSMRTFMGHGMTSGADVAVGLILCHKYLATRTSE